MRIQWSEQARRDIRYWQTNDRKIFQHIQALITDIEAHPFSGLGKPEPLRFDRSGYWSRRITRKHRLVYRVDGSPPVLIIAQCRFHY